MSFHRNWIVGAFLALFVTSCGAGSGQSFDRGSGLHATSAGPSQVRAEVSSPQAVIDARWQEILSNPGNPGVDYDPTLLTVTYFPHPVLPPARPSIKLQGSQRAESQGNSILRKLPGFEALSNQIAEEYGLGIETQVYKEGLIFAAFRLSAGSNGGKIISAMRQRYSGAVKYVTYSRLYKADYTPNDPDFKNSSATNGFQWGQKRIGCETAWDNTTGQASVQVGVVDSGVRLSHEEIAGSNVLDPELAFAGQECDVRNHDNVVNDSNGHGTFIAGLVGAQMDNARTITGVSPGCQVIPIKISNGQTTTDNYMLAGVVLAVDLGAEVVNLSWGGPSPTPNLQDLVAYCKNHDVLFVCAAGNDDTTAPDYPGAFADSLCVGATNPSDGRSSFSNFGDYVDIAAPGESLRSTFIQSDSDYFQGDGTSFAAPIVAAGAALLLSVDSSLTAPDLRALLLAHTVQTTGFSGTSPVGRLDLGAAVVSIAKVTVSAPQLETLVQSGTITLDPPLVGTPDKVELYFDGNLVQTLANAPYSFQLDTSSVSFGSAGVDFIAYRGVEQSTAHMDLVVDNAAAIYPLQESFDGQQSSLAAADAKRGYSDTLLGQLIRLPASDWDDTKLADNGQGQWRLDASLPFDGSFSGFCGTGTLNYGAYEVDCQVTRRISLAGISNSSLTFHARYNLEDGGTGHDRAYVLASTDGANWDPLNFHLGGEAFLSGNNLAWTKYEVDLSSYDNQAVYLAFVMASDGDTSGEALGQAGFWLDKITVASGYNEDVASVGGVNIQPFSLFGQIPDALELNLSLIDPVNVANASFVLDYAPLGVMDSYDQTLDLSAAPFSGVLSLPQPVAGQHNQLASLRVIYHDSNSIAGPELDIPVYIFNQRGDTNADGFVDASDMDGFAARVGLTSSDPGYIPFYDTDLDGEITELDAAAVGYNFGASL